MPEILHMFAIDAPAETVYQSLTQPNHLAKWWTHEVTAEPAVDSIAEFRFDQIVFRMQITDLSPNRRVTWRCIEGMDEWVDTQLSFDIEPRDDREGVMLHFAHRGWESADGGLAHCNYDWGRYLSSLRQLCETGAGSPYPNPPR